MQTSHITNVANESVADYFACLLKWKTSSGTTLFTNNGVVADQISSCHFKGPASLTGLLINWNLVSDTPACRFVFTRCLNRCWQAGWVTSYRHRMISILIYSTICISSMHSQCVRLIFTFPFVTTTQAGNFRLFHRSTQRKMWIIIFTIVSSIEVIHLQNLSDDYINREKHCTSAMYRYSAILNKLALLITTFFRRHLFCVADTDQTKASWYTVIIYLLPITPSFAYQFESACKYDP